MDPNTFPTKGNLILAKNSLALSRQGYELMDKKRNILIRELMELISEATDIQKEIDVTFSNAYKALQKANIQMGIHEVEQVSLSVPVENSIRIKRRSVMGTEIPKVEYEKKSGKPSYSFYGTKMSLDEACAEIEKVKELTIRLAEIENSAYRLAYNSKIREAFKRNPGISGRKRKRRFYKIKSDQKTQRLGTKKHHQKKEYPYVISNKKVWKWTE